MQALRLTEWLNSPETRLLLVLVRQRKAKLVQGFLTGNPVDQLTQGRAAAFHDLEVLLSSSTDHVKATFETALKGPETT